MNPDAVNPRVIRIPVPRLSIMHVRLTSALCLILGPAVLGQQFIEQPGVLTGPELWSESITPLDVNEDGNLDLFIANAQGYEVPGDFGAPSSSPLRPTLLIQTGLNGGVPVFEDRTDALIPPSIVVHGKAAAVCDVDGDGLDDIVIAVAFGDQQRLLLKDPAGPGYLDESHRLGTLVLNAFHVGAGDLDDDGDMDLVFADAGPNSFSAPGGKARLLINDGNGFFAHAPGQMNAIKKVGAQNAKIVDIDGDLDLDVIVDGKSSVTQVYLNDGAAEFTLDTSLVPTAVQVPGAGAYETEWGDLDGDLDIDCVYMNFAGSGFPTTDIAMENQLSQTGAPNLVAVTDALLGQNAQDENDFALMDTDDDGDLDLVVAALTFGSPVTPEKLFLNSGSFGPGFLQQVPGAFTGLLDATLDIAVADFDHDGRYDLVTANGEIPTSSFVNRYYRNLGPTDSTSPTIGRVASLPQWVSVEDLARDLSVRSWIQDSVVDDGATYVTAELSWQVTKGNASNLGTSAMPHVGGNIHRGVLDAQPTTEGLVGAMVKAEVSAEDGQGNASLSTQQSFLVCGAEAYGSPGTLSLIPPRSAGPGGSYLFRISGGQPQRPGVLAMATQQAMIPIAAGTLLVDPNSTTRVVFQLDANGKVDVSVPISSSAQPGETRYFQALARTTAHSSGMALSGGVETVVCE